MRKLSALVKKGPEKGPFLSYCACIGDETSFRQSLSILEGRIALDAHQTMLVHIAASRG